MMRFGARSVFFTLYFFICFAANVWPVALLANRIYPMVFGIPFFFFWAIIWSCLVFLGVLTLYVTESQAESE